MSSFTPVMMPSPKFIFTIYIMNWFDPRSLTGIHGMCRGRLDIDRMNKAAEYLKGMHDFSSFCAAGGDVIDHVRIVSGISLRRRARGLISISMEADGFLRYMVRNVVGTLVDAGSGKIEPHDVRDILDALSHYKIYNVKLFAFPDCYQIRAKKSKLFNSFRVKIKFSCNSG